MSYEGFTEDGSRGVVLSVSSGHADDVAGLAQEKAFFALIDNVLCTK